MIRESVFSGRSLWGGKYKGTPAVEGYTLDDGTPLNLSEKDQKWLGLKDTFKF